MDYDGEEDNFLVDFDPFEHAEDDYESQEDEEMPKAPPEFNKVAKEFDIDLRYSRENNLQRRVRPDDIKLKIIQVVKDYPCLYDRKCEYFRNPSYTARAWNNVASRVRMSKDECRMIFTSLFREFAITYVILRDQKLVDEGLHRRKIFIYYDHMLFFRNQINVPMVRQNQVQAIVNGLNRNIVKKDNHRARREKNFDAKYAELVKGENVGEKLLEQPATVLYEAEDIKETTTLTDVDLAYSKDNNLPAKILPDDFNVKVINAVKAYPCLYDRTSENFKNHTLKDHAWTDVAKMLNCEKGECKKTFATLFREFSMTYVVLRDKELVRMKILPKIFIYYDHMMFFKKQINIPLVRRNEIQHLLNIAEGNKSKPLKPKKLPVEVKKIKEDIDGDNFDPFVISNQREKAMGKKLGSFDTDLAYIKKHKLRERIGPEDKSLKLIKAIEKYPCLYDEKHPDYIQNKNQQPAWRKVSEMTNIPLLQCWSKFKALFFNFSTTYVILQDPTLVAQGLPKMFLYYEHMLFLKPFVKFHGIRKHYVPFIVKKIMKNRSAKEAKAQKNPQSRPATKQPQVNPWKPWMGDNPPNFGKSPPVSSDGSQSGPSTSQYSAAHLSDHPRAGNSKFSSFPIDEELSEKQIQQLQKYSLTFHKKLIKMVKQFPCLYNTNSQDYHNVEMKQIIWEEISKKCARSSNECRDAFNYLLKKFGETYVGKMVSRLGVPEETKRKPFQHYRELRFLKRYIPLQEVKDSLLQDPRYTLVQKMMITEFQHSPDTSPDISELRVPKQWDSPANVQDVWEEEPWENEFDREDLQLMEVDRLLPSRPQQWDRDADERDRLQWERDRMQERERENNLRDSQWERDSDRRGGPPQWEKDNVLRGFQELERDHDSRDSPQWERDREARGSRERNNDQQWERDREVRGSHQQWERDNENSDLRNNFSRNSHNPITPPPPQHYSGFSGGASGQTDPGNSQWNNTERPVVDVDEVDSFFQHLSQKIKDSNIGSHTFIDVQSAILNVLACKLRTY